MLSRLESGFRITQGHRFALGVAALLGALLHAPPALARPGTHPIAVSTFDTRASSVALSYRRGFMSGGGYNHVGYNANFTSTTGVINAQFGLHYLNYKAKNESAANGVGGGAIALFNAPLTRRFENGLPIVSIAPYLGIVPTALISGQQSFLSFPAVLGLSLPMSPGRFITITPWFEAALSVDLDTVIKPISYTRDDICNLFGICIPAGADPNDPTTWDPNNPPQFPSNGLQFNEDTVNQIVAQGVKVDLSVNAPMRFGLDAALHMSDTMDFDINGGLSTFGSAFSGRTIVFAGASLLWRWDDIVPGVLPPEKRLLRENCNDVEARFRTCPAARTWLKPEQVKAEREAAAREDAQKAGQKTAPITPSPAPNQTTPAASPPVSPAPPPAAAPAPAPAPAAAPAPASAPAAAPAPSPAAAPLPPADFPR